VRLRDRLPTDVDAFLRWQTQGQWRLLDAPWEGVRTTYTEAEEAQYRQRFLEQLADVPPSPRKRTVIALLDDRPVGWVIRYGEERSPDTWMIGIDICEDDLLERGLGSEALRLWVDYLFGNSTIHRIGLDTWSFNPRMMRVAEKLGFIPEGAQREVLQWQGEWLDLVHYGMLREEWEKIALFPELGVNEQATPAHSHPIRGLISTRSW
jgi:RimJ/RimL family protein N-acetyltransferase